MSIPSEYAWIIPLLAPFIVGVLVGVLIKKTAKLAVVAISIILILAALGYIGLPDLQTLIQQARQNLPQLQSQLQGRAGDLANLLPYSSGSFLVGLALGLWKG